MHTMQKIVIANLVIRRNYRIKQVAKDWGISPSTVRRYMDDLDANIEIMVKIKADEYREQLKRGNYESN